MFIKGNTYIQRNGKSLFVRNTKGINRLIYEHTCNYCGRDFISNRRSAKYCSDSCRVQGHKKRKNATKQ